MFRILLPDTILTNSKLIWWISLNAKYLLDSLFSIYPKTGLPELVHRPWKLEKHGKLPLITTWPRSLPYWYIRPLHQEIRVNWGVNQQKADEKSTCFNMFVASKSWMGRIDEWLNDGKQLGLMESTDYICGVFLLSIIYYLDGGFKFCFNHYC